jgi:hypothetical protein
VGLVERHNSLTAAQEVKAQSLVLGAGQAAVALDRHSISM